MVTRASRADHFSRADLFSNCLRTSCGPSGAALLEDKRSAREARARWSASEARRASARSARETKVPRAKRAYVKMRRKRSRAMRT
jgi:hypothetical protein